MTRRFFIAIIAALIIAVPASGHWVYAEPTGNDITWIGHEHRDWVELPSGDDLAKGMGGNDDIYGTSGNDDLRGNGGADYINGGLGFDECDGGPGVDTFRYCETVSQE